MYKAACLTHRATAGHYAVIYLTNDVSLMSSWSRPDDVVQLSQCLKGTNDQEDLTIKGLLLKKPIIIKNQILHIKLFTSNSFSTCPSSQSCTLVSRLTAAKSNFIVNTQFILQLSFNTVSGCVDIDSNSLQFGIHECPVSGFYWVYI